MSSSSSGKVAHVSMLVRRPPEEVFDAFVDPATTTKFWIGSASGPLEPGATVHWEFKVPGSKVDTTVTHFDRGRALAISWSDGTTVTWQFQPHELGTVVDIVNAGFGGDADAAVDAALVAVQGFAIVLCDLKTYLEQGTESHLSADKAVLIEEEARQG